MLTGLVERRTHKSQHIWGSIRRPAITLRLLERVAPGCPDDHGAWPSLESVTLEAEHPVSNASDQKRRCGIGPGSDLG